jgi:hypothetical protein
MKKIEITLYKFSDLSQEAKEKAIESNRNINVWYFNWYEFVYDQFKEETKEFRIDKMYFSGFGSQGDGAMFEGEFRTEFLKSILTEQENKKYRRILPFVESGQIEVTSIFKHYGHYYHERSYKNLFDFQINSNKYIYWSKWNETSNVETLIKELEEIISDFYETKAVELYSNLQKEYEYQTSDNAVIDTIEANEYDFTEDGKVY